MSGHVRERAYVNGSLGRFARFLHSGPMSVRASNPSRLALCAALLALATVTHVADAQKLYRYQDANGVWVYTDRQPGARQEYRGRAGRAAVRAARGTAARARHGQRRRADRAEHVLRARADRVSPACDRERLGRHAARRLEGAAAAQRHGARRRRQGRRCTSSCASTPSSSSCPASRAPSTGPSSRTDCRMRCRAPCACRRRIPTRRRTRDPASQHAVDFVMPIGTDVFAARDGVVIEVASDFFESGTNWPSTARARTSCASCTTTARWRSTCT